VQLARGRLQSIESVRLIAARRLPRHGLAQRSHRRGHVVEKAGDLIARGARAEAERGREDEIHEHGGGEPRDAQPQQRADEGLERVGEEEAQENGDEQRRRLVQEEDRRGERDNRRGDAANADHADCKLVCRHSREIECSRLMPPPAFGGVFSVVPTPFDPAGELDPASLGRVIELFLGDGVNGFTALGVTSEVARLTEAERDRVLDAVLASVNGRVPVVAGTTAEGLRTCIDYTRRAKAAGAAAVMISPPRMPKINSDAVAKHFAEVASAVDIPIIVQDYPPISGYAMEPSLLARIARDVPAARTIKLEDPPTPFKTSRILDQAKGLDVAIFGGLGGVFLLEELMAGAAGAMTGFAFPAILVKIVTLFRAGKIDEAADAFYASVPLMRFEFQEGIGMAIRKEVLRRRGAIAHAGIRPPGGTLDQTTRDALDRVLAWTSKNTYHGGH